jgi:hypothetical protein
VVLLDLLRATAEQALQRLRNGARKHGGVGFAFEAVVLDIRVAGVGQALCVAGGQRNTSELVEAVLVLLVAIATKAGAPARWRDRPPCGASIQVSLIATPGLSATCWENGVSACASENPA